MMQAKEAGAKITMNIMTTDYGSRDFSAEDPEGGDTMTALECQSTVLRNPWPVQGMCGILAHTCLKPARPPDN